MARILGSGAALVLALSFAGCSAPAELWACETPAQEYALKVAQLVPTFRGSAAVVTDIAAAADGKRQVLVARISGATSSGEHAGSEADLGMWVAYGDKIVEVTKTWNGELSDGATIDWSAARQTAMNCLAGNR